MKFIKVLVVVAIVAAYAHVILKGVAYGINAEANLEGAQSIINEEISDIAEAQADQMVSDGCEFTREEIVAQITMYLQYSRPNIGSQYSEWKCRLSLWDLAFGDSSFRRFKTNSTYAY